MALPVAVLKSAVTAMLKFDKFEVTSAALADDGEGINFNAKSKSGQVRITGIFSDPQQKLELEEPAVEAPGANELAEEDDDDTH